MKKLLFTIVFAVALCFYVSGASAVLIGGIEKIGPVADSGSGFGNVSNILTLQNPSFDNNTEIGKVSWSVTGDVRSDDATNSSQTWLFSAIFGKGITDASQLGIVYNVNQQGNLGGLTTTLNYFSLQVYDLAGNEVFSTDPNICVGCGTGFVPIAQGTGGAGYLFDLDSAAEVALNFYFETPDRRASYRLGATGSVSLANDGPDNFFFAKISGVTPVPEPVSMLLFGTGLVGIGGYMRKKFKQN